MTHQHGHRNEKQTLWAALLTGGFMLVEVAGGLIAGSLALLADAAHMLTDAASLTLAWLAFRLSRRPADWKRTYGFDRLQVLVAFANGLSLFFIVAWIFLEAIDRLRSPVEVLAGPMLLVALAGLGVNIGAFALLHRADRENLNIQGAMLHVLGDLLGSVAAIVAAGIILLTGWTPIDPLLSVLVGVLILRSAWHLVTRSGHILLEGAPAGLDAREIKADLITQIPEVHEVYHVHAWSLTQERPMVTLHARISPDADNAASIAAIQQRLLERFGADHVTVQVEHANHDEGGAAKL